MISLSKNKKGSLTDPIVGGILLVITVVTIFSVVTFWNEFKEQMTIEVQDSSANETIVTDMESMSEYYTWFDWGVPAIVLGLLLSSLIMAMMSGASFIYSIVSIIMWAIVMLSSFVFNEIFTEYASYFPTVAANYPIIGFIMTNINIVSLIWVVLLSFVMFLQNRGGAGIDKGLTAQTKFYTGTA